MSKREKGDAVYSPLDKMKGIKPLQPSLREKKRYIAFEIVSKKNFSFSQASKAVLDSALKYSGIKGLADMGLVFLKEKFSKNKGVVRISTRNVNTLKAALTLVKEIDKIPVVLKVIKVSGVLQRANEVLGG